MDLHFICTDNDMNIPKDHHFLPIFYFKPWCNNGQLLKHEAGHGTKITSTPKSPKSIAFETGLYSLVDVPPTNIGDIEVKLFRDQIDAPTALVFQKLLIGNGQITDREHGYLMRFLTALIFRSPLIVNGMKQNTSLLLRQELEKFQIEYEEFKNNDDPNSILQYFDKYFSPAYRSNIWVWVLESIINSPERGQKYTEMNWIIRDLSNSGIELVTSDRPLVVIGDTIPKEEMIALPISPKKALLGLGDNVIRATDLSKINDLQLAQELNYQVIIQAEKCVYTTQDNRSPLGLELLAIR